jgi:hypothetical protein
MIGFFWEGGVKGVREAVDIGLEIGRIGCVVFNGGMKCGCRYG